MDVCPERSTGLPKPAPHCFCVGAEIQHAMMNHSDALCCWCGQQKCFNYKRVGVQGHGPHKTTLEQIDVD